MAYYPKSQIKTSLYTNGGEYSLSPSNNTPQASYVGYYYKTSNGNLFSGKDSSASPTYPLYVIEPSIPDSTTNPEEITLKIFTSIPESSITVNQYSSTSNIYKKRTVPSFSLTLPTDQDKQNGYFTRYFCKKNNELKYFEISKTTFDKLQSKDSSIAFDLYSGCSLLWTIKGNLSQVTLSNSTSIANAANFNQWPGFSQYFKNLSQYYVGL